MKKGKQFQKGKHLYIKSGNRKEVRTIKEPKPPEMEFDKYYQEVYVDEFRFEKTKDGIKIFFGKKIFGTDRIKPKRTILLNKGTAKKTIQLLENACKGVVS